jgi:hypothetical protein
VESLEGEKIMKDDRREAISKVLDAAREMIEQHLDERSPDVAQALGLSEEGKVGIGIAVKIEDAGGGQFTLDVGFRLVKERIRDSKTRIVSTQPTLIEVKP